MGPRSFVTTFLATAVAATAALAGANAAAGDAPQGAFAPHAQRAAAHDIGRTGVVPGIVAWNQRWTAPDGSPERSSLMSVDLTNPHLSADVYSAYRVTNGPYMQVRTMMAASGAVAGINGDFFDLTTSRGQTTGGLVRSGAIWKTPRPDFNANFYVRSDGTAGIGPVTVTGSVRTIRNGHRVTHPLISVNKLADAAAGRMTLVTRAMDGTSVPANCTVVAAKITKGAVATGLGVTVTKVVTRTRYNAYLPQVPARTVALVGCGGTTAWLRTALAVKRTATITVGFAGLHPTALVSGAQVLIKDGKGFRDPHAHVITGAHAETFACVSRDARHLLLGTIDMFDWWSEYGVTMAQLRHYLLVKKCWSAMAFDGGGSSTLDYHVPGSPSIVTVNHPADGQERYIPDALLFYYKP